MPGCRRARSTPRSVESHRFDLIDVPEETTDTLTEQIRELATANAELKTALAAKKKENNQLVRAQKQTEAAMCNVWMQLAEVLEAKCELTEAHKAQLRPRSCRRRLRRA